MLANQPRIPFFYPNPSLSDLPSMQGTLLKSFPDAKRL
nr:hypothetical protein Q903MT_gene5904 [Picea sitchensis]